MKQYVAAIAAAALCCVSCAEKTADTAAAPKPAVEPIRNTVPVQDAAQALEELAEAERAGSYFAGMGFLESMFREQGGDYAGALFAAFKEMSWLYATGQAEEGSVEAGLSRIAAGADFAEGKQAAAADAAETALAFARGDYEAAAEGLRRFPAALAEPDSMGSWMLLVCGMETAGGVDSTKRAAYSAIRARFTVFPDYWRRGMRYFGGDLGAEYAEHCIDAAPLGPYAAECRVFLAERAGVAPENAAALRTAAELENMIAAALNNGNPALLEDVFPLLALADNRYTFLALELLRPVSRRAAFGEWLRAESEKASGRLADRLAYLGSGTS